MGARDLLADLAGLGVTVTAHGDRLVIRPASKLTDDIRERLRAAKPELLAVLAGKPECRPYRLTSAEADAAHADPWDDGAIARFQARAGLIRRHGFAAQDAEDLAERLHLRDVHADYRHLCLECSHYRPGRCGNHKAADLLSPAVGNDLASMFQDCPGFVPMGDVR